MVGVADVLLAKFVLLELVEPLALIVESRSEGALLSLGAHDLHKSLLANHLQLELFEYFLPFALVACSPTFATLGSLVLTTITEVFK